MIFFAYALPSKQILNPVRVWCRELKRRGVRRIRKREKRREKQPFFQIRIKNRIVITLVAQQNE